MKRNTATKVGYTKSFKWALIAFVFIEILFLVFDAKGDFVNGTLSYLDAQNNIYFFGFLIVIFGLTYALGIKAGLDMLVYKKKRLSVGAINAGVSVIAIVCYLLLVSCVRKGRFDIDGGIAMISSVKGLLLFVFVILTWVIAVRQISLYVGEDK